MGRMTRWFQSAVQVFRACVGRGSAQTDVQKGKATKKKRSYRLWVFRIKRKDGDSPHTGSCPSASTSTTTTTTESTRDGSKVTGSTTKKPVHGNSASRRGRQEFVKRKCEVSSTINSNLKPGKQRSAHIKNSKCHLSAKTCGRETTVQATNMVHRPVFGPLEKDAASTVARPTNMARLPVFGPLEKDAESPVCLPVFGPLEKDAASTVARPTNMARLPVFGPLEKDATTTIARPAKNNSPGVSETRQFEATVSTRRKGTTGGCHPAPKMKGRSPHQPATRIELGKTVQIPPTRHAQKRAGEKAVDMPEAKLKKRNTHQVSTYHVPAVVHETAVDAPLKSVLKRLGGDLSPGCSRAKGVTFGEKVQVKVYKVRAAGRLRDASSEDLHYERTDDDCGVN